MALNFVESSIVWARKHPNDIYWPAKIIHVTNKLDSTWTNSYSNHQSLPQYNYLIQYIGTNESIWTNDLLAYHQHRHAMINSSFVEYGLHPSLKANFLHAVQQADHANHQLSLDISNIQADYASIPILHSGQSRTFTESMNVKADHDFLSTPTLLFETNRDNANPLLNQDQTATTNVSNFTPTMNRSSETLEQTADAWWLQQGLLIESITPPLPSVNETSTDLIVPKGNSQATSTLFIVTTRNYSAPAFLSYLMHTLTHFDQRSIIYLDDPIGVHQPHAIPTTSNIIYLISCDQFHSSLQQNLNTFVFDSLTAHLNYFFLILNAPCHQLIHHVYEKVLDKRTILVLQYHSTYNNESLLLCSGDRKTFEMFQSNLLKYLCNKVKFIDGTTSNVEQQLLSSVGVSSILQSNHLLHQFFDQQIQQTIHQRFDPNFLRHNAQTMEDLFSSSLSNKPLNKNANIDTIHHENGEMFDHDVQQTQRTNDLFTGGSVPINKSLPILEYYQQNHYDKC